MDEEKFYKALEAAKAANNIVKNVNDNKRQFSGPELAWKAIEISSMLMGIIVLILDTIEPTKKDENFVDEGIIDDEIVDEFYGDSDTTEDTTTENEAEEKDIDKDNGETENKIIIEEKESGVVNRNKQKGPKLVKSSKGKK
jgi:hypothetical protein